MTVYTAPKLRHAGSVTQSTSAAGLGLHDPKNPLVLGLDSLRDFGFQL
jgi:hypothetical protein